MTRSLAAHRSIISILALFVFPGFVFAQNQPSGTSQKTSQRTNQKTAPGSQAAQTSQPDASSLVHRVVQNELNAQDKDNSLWEYQKLSVGKDGKKELRDVVQTKDGEIDRLVAVNGEPLAPRQQAVEGQRVQSLVSNPTKMAKARASAREDGKKEESLLKMLPDAFNYQIEATEGRLTKLHFVPNPGFKPPTREAQVFHHLEGTMWVDTKDERLARMEGQLTSEVKFGAGILGRLDKGGTFRLVQADVGDGHWEVAQLDIHVKGKALFFKTINQQESDTYTKYQQVPQQITLSQAADRLKQDAENGASTNSTSASAS